MSGYIQEICTVEKNGHMYKVLIKQRFLKLVIAFDSYPLWENEIEHIWKPKCTCNFAWHAAWVHKILLFSMQIRQQKQETIIQNKMAYL